VRGTLRAPSPAGSFLGGFRTPATGVCRAAVAGRHPKPFTLPVLPACAAPPFGLLPLPRSVIFRRVVFGNFSAHNLSVGRERLQHDIQALAVLLGMTECGGAKTRWGGVGCAKLSLLPVSAVAGSTAALTGAARLLAGATATLKAANSPRLCEIRDWLKTQSVIGAAANGNKVDPKSITLRSALKFNNPLYERKSPMMINPDRIRIA
jgi:hypothetical protein